MQAIGNGELPSVSATDVGSIGDIGKLFATGARYLVNRPKTSQTTQESSRSVDANARFRLSKAQAAIEAQGILGNGDKNA